MPQTGAKSTGGNSVAMSTSRYRASMISANTGNLDGTYVMIKVSIFKSL